MKLKIFGVIVCFSFSFLAINYWSQASFDIVQKEQRSLFQQLTIKRAIEIEQQLSQVTSHQQWLSYEIAQQQSLALPPLRQVAQHIIKHNPAIAQIAFSPNSVTQLTVPNVEGAAGNLIITPPNLDHNSDLDGHFYEPPYYINGQTQFIKHIPVLIEQRLWGYISYTLNLNHIFSLTALKNTNERETSYQLVHINKHNKETILVQSRAPLSHKVYQASIHLPNANLLLKLSPLFQSYSSTSVMNIIFSLSVASIFTLVCYLGLTEPTRIRRRLTATQKDLDDLNIMQQALMNNISEEVVFCDVNGQVISHNSHNQAVAHYPSNILFGDNEQRESDSLYQADGSSLLDPTQHPTNRALFNGENINQQAILVNAQQESIPLQINSKVIKNSKETVGVLTTTTQLAQPNLPAHNTLSRSSILEMLEQGQPLSSVFEFAIAQTQQALDNITVTISLIDTNQHKISEIHALDLPSFYRRVLLGSDIKERLMSSNSAIFQNKMIVVEDINLHPYWIEHKALAHHAGFRACWSQPIRDSHGKALGSVDFYANEVLAATPATLIAIKEAAQLIELILERHKVIFKQNRITLAMEHSHCAVSIVTPDGVIEYINPKYYELSGYSAQELSGKFSPVFDTKGLDQSQIEAIKTTLENKSTWQGNLTFSHKNGVNYTVNTVITPIFGQDNQLIQYVISQSDAIETIA